MAHNSITQTPVLVKIDTGQLHLLNELCKGLGCNRNKLINFFIFQGVSLLSMHKECALVTAYSSALKEII